MKKHKRFSVSLSSLTLMMCVLIIASCSKPTVQDKVNSEIRDFNQLKSVILEKDVVHEKNVSKKGSAKIYRSLVKILNNSKLSKRVQSYAKIKNKRNLKKKVILEEFSGISGMGDTLIAKFLKVLKTGKCSNLKERVVIVRQYLIQCLVKEIKPNRITKFKYKLTTIKKLKTVSKKCKLLSEKLEDKLNINDSRKCYYDKYRRGKFISPLVIID